jgi:hypothetical protein
LIEGRTEEVISLFLPIYMKKSGGEYVVQGGYKNGIKRM